MKLRYWIEQVKFRSTLGIEINRYKGTPASYKIIYADGLVQDGRLLPQEINKWVHASNTDRDKKRSPHLIVKVLDSKGVVVWPNTDSSRSGAFLSGLSAYAWDGFFKNPFAWIFFALFLVAEYGNYQRGKDLARVCELTGPHDIGFKRPLTEKQELDAICIDRQPDD